MMYFRGVHDFGSCVGYGSGFIGPWIMMGVGVLVLAAIIITAVVLLKKASRHKTSDDALDALKLRYVKGEITEEDYLKMKKILVK